MNSMMQCMMMMGVVIVVMGVPTMKCLRLAAAAGSPLHCSAPLSNKLNTNSNKILLASRYQGYGQKQAAAKSTSSLAKALATKSKWNSTTFQMISRNSHIS